MKVAPLNRWDFYKNMGVGIIAFGLLFNPMDFLEKLQKKKRKKATVQLGLFGHSAAGPEGIQPARGCHVEGVKVKYAFSHRSEMVRARVRFKPDGWIPPVRACG